MTLMILANSRLPSAGSTPSKDIDARQGLKALDRTPGWENKTSAWIALIHGRKTVPLFCFSITLDEDAPLERPSSCDNNEDAIQEGCDVLMGLVSLLRPEIARCGVYEGGDMTAPPVGSWAYKAPSPLPNWCAHHD